MGFDLVIRNGTVVDGTGLGSYRADVGVNGGRIAEIGKVRGIATTEIDAEGHIVTPGFVDVHTHLDAQVFWDPAGTNSCWHGVTTAVMGNCGFTLAPANAGARELVVRNLERAEDMNPAALEAGVEWTWESFPEYLDAVDRLPKGINVAANIGHSALRTWAMGERAFEGTASDDDLRRMIQELRRALDAGAIGLTTSSSPHHETSDDRPVASRLAAWDEVCRLTEVLGERSGGVFEFADGELLSPDGEVRSRAAARLVDLCVATGVLFTFGFVATSVFGPEMTAMIDAAGRRGGRMIGQTHCRDISVLLSFATTLPFDILPEWREVRSQPLAEQVQMLRDPHVRSTLADAAETGTYGWRDVGTVPRKPDYLGIRVYDAGLPPHRSVQEVADARGIRPVEAMIELALESDLQQMFIQPSTLPQDRELLRRAMAHPRTVMSFSDSGAHVSQIADASIHTYLLGHWVRDEGLLTVEEAVRMMSFGPAMAWGFSDRGLVREGMVADLNVIDPATVGPSVPHVAHDLPAGGRRIVQRAEGMAATVVAGEVTIENGKSTGRVPGRLLRRARVG